MNFKLTRSQGVILFPKSSDHVLLVLSLQNLLLIISLLLHGHINMQTSIFINKWGFITICFHVHILCFFPICFWLMANNFKTRLTCFNNHKPFFGREECWLLLPYESDFASFPCEPYFVTMCLSNHLTWRRRWRSWCSFEPGQHSSSFVESFVI